MKNENSLESIPVWTPVKSTRSGVVGYLEKFQTTQGVSVSIPGVSRWIDGSIFDLSKAMIVE